MDGLELCRTIRSEAGESYTYFILLTARRNKDDRLEALAAGIDDFLTKPLDMAELAARLAVARRILDWEQKLRDLNAELRALSTAMTRQAADLDRLRRHAEHLAAHDGLTGALNRRSWFEAASNGTFTALAMFDVDHFKSINDRFGHPAGDAVLKQVVERLTNVIGKAGRLGRVGGEEFCVALDGPVADAEQLCQEAIAAFHQAPMILPGGKPMLVTVSGGMATRPPETASPEAALSVTYEAADKALYRAKNTGRARLCLELAEAA
jgi:diguanylate cyclase (GGDEF)-like protein